MKKLVFIAVVAMAAMSCNMVRELSDTAAQLRHGEVIARVGKHRLHRSELEKFIPAGVSPEDSAGLAQRYVNAWAEELLMLDMAQEQLSKDQKDVSAELEEYRRSLLKYRYEQLYINQRLDTLITEEEIQRYYLANTDRFRLERPLLKARYMIISADARSLKTLKTLMSSDDEADVVEADSLGAYAAHKYADAADTWMDAITLAQEMGTDYRTLLASINNKSLFAEVDDGSGNLRIAYIAEMAPEGKPAPVEYVTERIRDIILSNRKHKLETDLEQDLLEDALRNQKFVIY